MRTVLDVCYNQQTQQKLDLYLPDRDEFYVLLYFHGGGLTGGDKTDSQGFYAYMVSQGVAVISANYRMYPQAKYPDFLMDAADAVEWVFGNVGQYGKVKGVYICGSSAGGYLTQMLCFDRTWLSKTNVKQADIAGFIHNSGQPTSHFNVLRERGMDTRRVVIDDSAPIYHVAEDVSYPPMLIVVSDDDLENRYEQTMLLVSTLKHFGYSEQVTLKVMNGGHCSYVNAFDENGESVFGKLVTAFIQGQTVR